MKNTSKYDPKFVQIMLDHVKNGDYVIDATLKVEMDLSDGAFQSYLKKYPEFREAHDLLKNSKQAAVVRRLVNGEMTPQCAKLLLDCFDNIIPESVRRDLDRKDRELELRLSGELTDKSSELYVNFFERGDETNGN